MTISRRPLISFQTGFTLLELLVALAVFAIMSIAAYSGLSSVLFTQSAVDAEAQRLTQIQMAFYFLEQDIEQMAPRSIRDDYDQSQPALKSGSLGDELITFTRTGWDNPLGRQRANLQRLSYRLEGQQLLRLYWVTLDRGVLSKPRETVLLDGVQEMTVRFLDGAEAWQTQWPPSGDSGKALDILPEAVEISITLDDWGTITRLFPLSRV